METYGGGGGIAPSLKGSCVNTVCLRCAARTTIVLRLHGTSCIVEAFGWNVGPRR
jgi:hypothetical protein